MLRVEVNTKFVVVAAELLHDHMPDAGASLHSAKCFLSRGADLGSTLAILCGASSAARNPSAHPRRPRPAAHPVPGAVHAVSPPKAPSTHGIRRPGYEPRDSQKQRRHHAQRRMAEQPGCGVVKRRSQPQPRPGSWGRRRPPSRASDKPRDGSRLHQTLRRPPDPDPPAARRRAAVIAPATPPATRPLRGHPAVDHTRDRCAANTQSSAGRPPTIVGT